MPWKGFVKSDHLMSTITFGAAIEAAKQGKAIARSGWNGKNMYVWMAKGNYASDTEAPKVISSGVNLGLFEVGDKGTVTRMPNLNMKAADGSTVTGWLASQTDILAEDWQILEA